MPTTENPEINRLKDLFKEYSKPVKFKSEEYKFEIVKQNKGRNRNIIPNELIPCELHFNKNPFGCFELVDEIKLDPKKNKEIVDFLNQKHYRYYILTTPNNAFFVYDKYQSTPFPKAGSNTKGMIDYLIKSVLHPEAKKRENEIHENISTKIESIINNKDLKNLFLRYVPTIIYSKLENTFKFKSSGKGPFENKETKLMRELLESNKINTIYRYGSMGTFKSTIETGNYRMNCILGMNDSSEIFYADHYFGSKDKIDEQTHMNKIHNINRKFISSCSEAKDDLNLWRFYGDNGKGMAMEISVDRNHKTINDTFFIGKVSYGNDKLKGIKAFVKGINEIGEIFGHYHLNVWKHFFKPKEYKAEQEIRIFYLLPQQKDKKDLKWTITDFGILNPYVEHSLKDSGTPFEIKRIIRGPAMPYTKHNRLEMKAMLVYKGFGNLDVNNSSITHFRSN